MMNRDENKYMVFYRIINGLVLYIYIYIYNLLDDTGCKTAMSWIKSAGSQHAIRIVNSGCKPKLLGGQRSKCLGFRMTP